ncbi:MAG: EamA family transporter RarD [Rhizobiales bacterium]|nr:EamA family transporter RarD [Hyphomicrobiales bacterium]NRB13045.1 EamA family transporter RarD [Hyphomicrobiales bacterium]
MPNNPSYKLGLIYATSAFFLWGVAVLFFKQISHVPPFEVIAHRSIWSLVLLAVIITFSKKWPVIFETLKSRKLMLTLALSSVLILFNWSVFIWAISNGYIIESSLGYFINPLLNVLIGVLVFNEKLTKAQTVAIGLAALAIVIRLVLAGTFPWIALSIATSFAIYGYIRKTVAVGAAEGLFLELLILLLPMIGFLYYLHINYGLSFFTIDMRTDILLVAAGAVTAVPLLLFSAGARIIRMTTLGLLQYIGPSLQFAIGLYYGEAFTPIDAIVFGLIWTGLIIYSTSSFRQARLA